MGNLKFHFWQSTIIAKSVVKKKKMWYIINRARKMGMVDIICFRSSAG